MHGGLARSIRHHSDCSHLRTGLATSAVREVEVIPLAEVKRLQEALRQAVDMLYRDDWTPEDRDALHRVASDETDAR